MIRHHEKREKYIRTTFKNMIFYAGKIRAEFSNPLKIVILKVVLIFSPSSTTDEHLIGLRSSMWAL